MLVGAIGQTRQIARGLLLASIKPAELDAHIAELCRVSSRKFNVDCAYTRAGPAPRLDDTQASHLFFIAQEALRNALKHASAKHIAITLREETGQLALAIADDGRGLQVNADAPAGLGLRIMQHRAALIGASLDIISPSQGNKGTRIRCALPRAAEKAESLKAEGLKAEG
jgi:signal transduction histidine kinase